MNRFPFDLFVLSFLIIVATANATAQELDRGTKVFVVNKAAADAQSVENDDNFRLEYGAVYRIEESAPNRYIVFHEGKTVYVNHEDVMTVEDTLDFVNKQIQAEPSADGFALKTHVLYSLKKFEDAVEASDQALQLDSANIKALQYRATSFYFMSRFDEARDIVEQLLELAPDHYLTHAIHFYMLTSDGDWQAALESIDKATQLNPWEGPLWSNMGFTQMTLGNRKAGYECIKKAMEIAPSYSGAYQLHAIYSLQDDDEETARKYLEKAAELNDKKFETYRLLAAFADQDGEHKEYREWIKRSAMCWDCPDENKRIYAWELATSQTQDRRDGKAALKIANALVDAGQIEPEFLASCLKTKAAALAELERFDEAFKTLELINPDSQDQLFEDMKTRFEDDQKYRDYSGNETYDL